MRYIIGFNRKLQPREVRVIGPDGTQLGIMPTSDAFKRAEEMELDLVGVQPNSNPPVCRIIDHGKFKYEQKKSANEAKKNQSVVELKEIKFRPKIGEHDFEVKLSKIREFLSDGNRVKITVMFRGRENIHKDIGIGILQRVADAVTDLGSMDGGIKAEGRTVFMLLTSVVRKKTSV